MKKSPGNTILISNYESICQEILSAFSSKHNLITCYWIQNNIGDFAVCNEKYFISLNDMIYDLKHNCKPNRIFQYVDHCTQHNLLISFPIFLKLYPAPKSKKEKPHQVSLP